MTVGYMIGWSLAYVEWEKPSDDEVIQSDWEFLHQSTQEDWLAEPATTRGLTTAGVPGLWRPIETSTVGNHVRNFQSCAADGRFRRPKAAKAPSIQRPRPGAAPLDPEMKKQVDFFFKKWTPGVR